MWFDDEIEWYTTVEPRPTEASGLWFDDEIEWYTTEAPRLVKALVLWFDDEIEWYTTTFTSYEDIICCGLMMK